MSLEKYYKRINSALLLSLVGVVAAIFLLFALSLPEKYSLTIACGLIFIPILLIISNREKFILGVFLLSLPLTMGIKLMEIPATTGSILSISFLFKLYLSDIFLILLSVCILLNIILNRQVMHDSILNSRIIIPLFLWIGMGILSLYRAVDRTVVLIEIVKLMRILLIFVVVYYYIKGTKEIHFILKCLLIALFIQSILMFVQYATNSMWFEFPGALLWKDVVEDNIRASGTMGHSGHFAKFSSLMLPVALSYILFSSKISNKFIYLLVWLSASVALILTISRMGIATWFSTFFSFLFGLIYLHIIPYRRAFHLLIIVLLVMSLSLGIQLYIGGERFKDRITYDAGSAAARMPMIYVALNIIKEHPLTGVGLSNYTFVHQNYDHTPEHISVKLDYPVHNLFLLYAAEIGILGLIFFLCFIYCILKYGIQCARLTLFPVNKATFLGVVLGVINIMIMSMTDWGVVAHLIHLSIIAIFAACVTKYKFLLNNKYDNNRLLIQNIS